VGVTVLLLLMLMSRLRGEWHHCSARIASSAYEVLLQAHWLYCLPPPPPRSGLSQPQHMCSYDECCQ